MKKSLLLLLLLFIPFPLNAQFEQKISIDLSAGGFKTFGKKFTEYTGPLQMANYKMGFSANGGIQIKLNDRLSLAAEAGIMFSTHWIYKGDYVDDLHWIINDTITDAVLDEGDNYLDIFNYSLGVKLKYYFITGKKWDPYFYTGVNANLTQSYFDNTKFAAYQKLGWISANEPLPSNNYLEQSFGMGLYPGFGIEFNPVERIHLYFEPGYYLIFLQKNKFKDPAREENFNAFIFHVGCRLNFIKTKELLK